MSARDQVFMGTVTGDVAGRDVVKNIHVGPQRPESELQAAFKRHTGIHCGRDVRLQMERLMDNHGFTSRELARAWKVGSMVWHEPTKRLKSSAGKLDMVVGWTGTALFTVVLILALVDTMMRLPGPFLKPATLLVTCLAYLAVTRAVLLATIFPQVTARRVEKILAGGD